MNNNTDKIQNNLAVLFKNWKGSEPEKTEMLPHSGSSRIYFRFSAGETTALGVYNQNNNENTAFISFTEHFLKYNLNVPLIYSSDLSKNIYLIQDFGDVDLLSWLNKSRNKNSFPKNGIELYKSVIRELIKFQVIAGKNFDYSNCYPFKSFEKEAILFDLNYFLDHFVKPGKYNYNQQNLTKDFNFLSDYLLLEENNFFMYRDFQARNIIIKDNQPCFIDYQGGRKGPLQYDLASLLYQAKANIPENIRIELVEYYIQEIEKLVSVNKEKFIEFFNAFSLIRILQTLGAYGLRGLVEGKSHFIESIGPALSNLALVMVKTDILNQTPELKNLLKRITANTTKNES
jgi:aminoglycoside/choline kinase family phosphotransferase